VKVEDSQFEQSATFLGSEAKWKNDPSSSYFLRSWVDKTSGAVKHQLYVGDYYNGSWIFWDRVNSQDAQPLEFVPITRRVVGCYSTIGCYYEETFGVSIPDAMLKAHQDGFMVKFYAKTGNELILPVTSQQIRQQLKAIDAYQTSLILVKPQRSTY
jgi:hypothetical protein